MFNIDGINADKTSGGVWASYMDGEFLIAHTSNLTFQREFNKLQYPYSKKIERGTLDPKIHMEILCGAMAKGILLDWKNVGAKGKELAYSVETATKILANNPDLREFIQEFALDVDNFRQEVIESQGKS